jgi:putative heme iron utilization protein
MPPENRIFKGSEVRKLMRESTKAAMSTVSPPDQQPYISLVTVAIGPSCSPVILISELALHTKNLGLDNRAALLFDMSEGLSDPLAGARVSVMGTFERTHDGATRDCFLNTHPNAKLYADFDDFGFWQMEIEKAHAIAGFGRIETLDANEVLGSG